MNFYRVFFVAFFYTIYLTFAQEKEIASSSAQSAISLKQAVAELELRYHVRFSYVDQTIAKYTVRTPIKGDDLQQSLEYILIGKPLAYKRIGKNIIVLYEDDTKKQEASGQFTSVRLTIVDARTSEGIYFANVTISGSRRGALSDAHGQAVVQHIPYGDYTLRITALGYLPLDKALHLSSQEISLDTIRLEPSDIRLDSTIVFGERETWRVSDPKLRVQPSVIVIDHRKINSTPSVLEPDLFRTLQTLPGVTAPNDLSNELYVRGGTPDQNLITMDRAIVYQPYHLFGIAGIFNTDAIEQVNFSTGGFSAQYGNRLSSVIDVRTKSASPNKFSATGNVSLLSSKITMDGQPNKHWYYLVSLRRTYLDFATKAAVWLKIAPESIPYSFYDGLSKVVYRPNTLHEFGTSLFFSQDKFFSKHRDYEYVFNEFNVSRKLPMYSVGRLDYGWGNLNAAIYWDWQAGDLFRSRVTISQSKATIKLDEDLYYGYDSGAPDSIRRRTDSLNALQEKRPFDTRNYIVDRGFAWDTQWEWLNEHSMYLGVSLNLIEMSYYWKNFNAPPHYVQVFYDFAPDSFRYQRRTTNLAFYIEDMWKKGDWTIKPGIRIENFSSNNRSLLISPRTAIRYDVSPKLALKGSAGIYYQSLFTARERGYIGFLEVPFSTENQVEKATHIIAGGEFFPNPNIRLTADIYFKHFNRLYRKDRSSDSLHFDEGVGDAYGLEITYRRIGNKMSFEADYSLAWVTRTFDQKTYVTNYDQRHTLNLLFSYRLPKNWTVDARWVLASGRAYRPTEFYGAFVDINLFDGSVGTSPYAYEFGQKNLDHLEFYDRYPFYHRLDISLVKTIRFNAWTLKPYVSIINTYYSNNPLFYDYATSGSVITNEPDPRRLYYSKRKSYGVPILPSFGAFFEF